MAKATRPFRQERSVLARRLAELRGSATTEEYARRYGMKRQQWERYENDRAVPSLAILIRIAAAEGISLDSLVGAARPLPPTTSPDPLTPDEVLLMADVTGHEAFRKLATIYKNRDHRPDIWAAISHNLDVFARAAEDAATARARVKRSPPIGDVKTRRKG